MDLLSIIRTLGGLGTVLGILWGALWLVRRYDIKLPGLIGGGQRNRLELVERLAIDARRSVTLLRRDGAEHLILIAPEGHLVIESGLLNSAEGPKAKADSATTDVVAASLSDGIPRCEKIFGPSFGPLVVAPLGGRISRCEKIFGPSFGPPVVAPLGGRISRWEKIFGPSFGQLIEEVRAFSVPVKPIVASANAEPIYEPARKTSTRRPKAAEATAHA